MSDFLVTWRSFLLPFLLFISFLILLPVCIITKPVQHQDRERRIMIPHLLCWLDLKSFLFFCLLAFHGFFSLLDGRK